MAAKHFDQHIHSTFSSDSEQDHEIDCIIERAISRGLSGISITDHLDPAWPDEENPSRLDVPAYEAALTKAKAFCEGRILFSKGVELGLLPGDSQKICDDVVNNFPYDFVIGSLHYSETTPVDYPAFHEGRTIPEIVGHYYSLLLESVKSYTNYDVLGHINAIDRSTSEIPSESLTMPYIDELLKIAIADGKGIELNVSSFGRYKHITGHGTPTLNMLKRFKELGGEIVTIGSDAHRIAEVGAFIDKGEELLRTVGYKYAAFFMSRKPEFYKL